MTVNEWPSLYTSDPGTPSGYPSGGRELKVLLDAAAAGDTASQNAVRIRLDQALENGMALNSRAPWAAGYGNAVLDDAMMRLATDRTYARTITGYLSTYREPMAALGEGAVDLGPRCATSRPDVHARELTTRWGLPQLVYEVEPVAPEKGVMVYIQPSGSTIADVAGLTAFAGFTRAVAPIFAAGGWRVFVCALASIQEMPAPSYGLSAVGFSLCRAADLIDAAKLAAGVETVVVAGLSRGAKMAELLGILREDVAAVVSEGGSITNMHAWRAEVGPIGAGGDWVDPWSQTGIMTGALDVIRTPSQRASDFRRRWIGLPPTLAALAGVPTVLSVGGLDESSPGTPEEKLARTQAAAAWLTDLWTRAGHDNLRVLIVEGSQAGHQPYPLAEMAALDELLTP